jgi:hypothetical protein
MGPDAHPVPPPQPHALCASQRSALEFWVQCPLGRQILEGYLDVAAPELHWPAIQEARLNRGGDQVGM